MMTCSKCSAPLHEDMAFATDAERHGVDARRLVCVNGHGDVVRPPAPRPNKTRKVVATAALLREWYVVRGMTAEQMGARFEASAKVVLLALKRARIPTRPRGVVAAVACRECGAPPQRRALCRPCFRRRDARAARERRAARSAA